MLEILKYTLPAALVVLTAWLMISNFLKAQLREQELKLKQTTRHLTAPIQLQAFERLTLFMERIDLFYLNAQLRAPQMTVADLQLTMTNQVRIEFDHNVSQQIYISNELWARIRSTKEETIMTINRIGSSMPPNAPDKEFSRAIIEYLNELDGVLLTQKTLEAIKLEARTIL